MAQDTTTTALRKTEAVTDDDINAAVDAIIGGDDRADYPVAQKWALDIPKALDAHKPWREALSSDKPAYQRSMIRTAVLLAKLDRA